MNSHTQQLSLADKIYYLEEAMSKAQQALNKAQFYIVDFPDLEMAEHSFKTAIEILTNGIQGGEND